MDNKVQISCWGIAARATLGVAMLMILGWLFIGPEVSTLIASR